MVDTGVIFLQKDKFDFFQPILGKVLEFRFVPEIVKDLDVVNSDLLENLIKLFIANNKIQPSGLVVVIADNACFIKDFTLTNTPPILPGQTSNQVKSVELTPRVSEDDIKNQINFFIEHVPFDEVASETYPLTNGTKVWATNKDLYGTIAKSFENQGFEIKGVIPGLVFEGGIGSKPVLDVLIANLILQKFDTAKEHSLYAKNTFKQQMVENKNKQIVKKSENVQESVETIYEPKPTTNKKRLVLLVLVFAVLIIIMIYLFITQKPLG